MIRLRNLSRKSLRQRNRLQVRRPLLHRGILRPLPLIFALALTSARLFALDETFDLYNAPQALAMGNAFSAVASGHTALFYNPAGLAKGNRREFEVKPLAFDLITSGGMISTAAAAQTTGMYRLFRSVPDHPGSYNFLRASMLPALAGRGFGVAVLGSYRFAARPDGPNIDVDAGTDFGLVTGGAINLAGNLIKIGVTLKAIERAQLKGVYDPTNFADETAIASQMREGLGIGGDIGFLFTLPQRYLPTLSLVCNDVLGTQFIPSKFLNPSANGKPDTIPQSVHAGFSVQPNINKRVHSTLTAEFRHIERNDLPIRKHLHFGLQVETDRSFYVWLGLNQMYLTGGIALRVPGGDLEMGTYGEDVGAGDTAEQDRRFFLRYTIGF